MSNKKKKVDPTAPAYPCKASEFSGLTIRLEIATRIAAGMMSNEGEVASAIDMFEMCGCYPNDLIVSRAFSVADALIAFENQEGE